MSEEVKEKSAAQKLDEALSEVAQVFNQFLKEIGATVPAAEPPPVTEDQEPTSAVEDVPSAEDLRGYYHQVVDPPPDKSIQYELVTDKPVQDTTYCEGYRDGYDDGHAAGLKAGIAIHDCIGGESCCGQHHK